MFCNDREHTIIPATSGLPRILSFGFRDYAGSVYLWIRNTLQMKLIAFNYRML